MARWLIGGRIVEHRFPLFQFRPKNDMAAFVFNEGGRGFTLSIYRYPCTARLRVYVAGHVWVWNR
jgi:hypothetical protein